MRVRLGGNLQLVLADTAHEFLPKIHSRVRTQK